MSVPQVLISNYLIQHMPRAKTAPIVAYKFVHKEDLFFWTQNRTLRIGTLKGYSDLVTDGGVGDIQELHVSGISHFIDDSESEKNQILRNNLAYLGVEDIQNCTNVTLENSSYTNPDDYVFCVSRKLNKKIFRSWKEKEGYDAVIRILDLQKLLSSILHYDSVGEKRLGPIGAIDLVKYLKYPEDLDKVDITKNRFLKDENQYSWQDEIRLFWNMEPQSSHYDIRLPNMPDLIEVMCLPCDW